MLSEKDTTERKEEQNTKRRSLKKEGTLALTCICFFLPQKNKIVAFYVWRHNNEGFFFETLTQKRDEHEQLLIRKHYHHIIATIRLLLLAQLQCARHKSKDEDAQGK